MKTNTLPNVTRLPDPSPNVAYAFGCFVRSLVPYGGRSSDARRGGREGEGEDNSLEQGKCFKVDKAAILKAALQKINKEELATVAWLRLGLIG